MSAEALAIEPCDGGRACTQSVRAQPNARRAEVAGTWNACLKVKVAAPPEDGRANDSLLELLSELFARARVTLVSGARSRLKTVRIEAPPALVRARLAELLG